MNDSDSAYGKPMSSDYVYGDASPGHHHAYLLPSVRSMLSSTGTSDRRLFDCGCGNGSFAQCMVDDGWDVTGVDPSTVAVGIARNGYPAVRVELGKWDHHHSVLLDNGHIKFWSIATLTALLSEFGFEVRDVARTGRIPPLAKSMVVRGVKRG